MRGKLAIHGGKPVRAKMLPYGRHHLDEDDIAAVTEVLRSGWLTTGPKVAEYEAEFAKRVGARYGVAVSSGTAALHAAVFAAGLAAGDEVITTPMTFAATANCVLYQGARPVFADVQPDTLNLDPASVRAAITARTRAIIAVDYTGQPADLDDLVDIARRHGLVFIEDAAHALGATYRGRTVGSIADLTTFSTHPVKHIATGEGGMITTASMEFAEKMRWFRNHGITTDHRERTAAGGWAYQMVALGFNYRLSDVNCALGHSQLRKLDSFLRRRRALAARYDAAFAGLPWLERPSVRPDRESAWHLYVVRLRLEALRASRGEIFAALRAENIGVNVHYLPVYWHPYYRELGYQRGLCPVAEAAYERLLTLPLFPAMSDRDADEVVQAVYKVLEFYAA